MFKEPGLEDLCYVIDEEVLLVTTEEKANETLSVQVYRVDDLLDSTAAVATQGFAINVALGENAQQTRVELARVIKKSVDWSFALGQSAEQEGPIDVLPELVIVRHAPRVLSQVQTVLSDMRILNLKEYDSGRRPECDDAGRLGGKAASSDLAEEPTADDDGI